MHKSDSHENCGVLFPKDMGNYASNLFDIEDIFRQLCAAGPEVGFFAYHGRRSGNFLFRFAALDEGLRRAKEVGKAVTGLPCFTRAAEALNLTKIRLPREINTTSRGSVFMRTEEGPKKVILVMLSETIPHSMQIKGRISSRVEILEWVSALDVLALYARPPKGGDVGQVTTAVLNFSKKESLLPFSVGWYWTSNRRY